MHPRRNLVLTLLGIGVALVAPQCGLAQGSATKDIVLDRINRPAAQANPAAPGDAMSVSVLLESPAGSLVPKPTSGAFKTGDRFRLKVLAARDGKISLFNTPPNGKLNPEPIWRGNVDRGLELVTPRLRLDGKKGTDQLHVLLEPPDVSGVTGWLSSFLGGKSKDIQLDVQNTTSATYLVNPTGKGLVTTLRITHR
jgi:hypothetical protein